MRRHTSTFLRQEKQFVRENLSVSDGQFLLPANFHQAEMPLCSHARPLKKKERTLLVKRKNTAS